MILIGIIVFLGWIMLYGIQKKVEGFVPTTSPPPPLQETVNVSQTTVDKLIISDGSDLFNLRQLTILDISGNTIQYWTNNNTIKKASGEHVKYLYDREDEPNHDDKKPAETLTVTFNPPIDIATITLSNGASINMQDYNLHLESKGVEVILDSTSSGNPGPSANVFITGLQPRPVVDISGHNLHSLAKADTVQYKIIVPPNAPTTSPSITTPAITTPETTVAPAEIIIATKPAS